MGRENKNWNKLMNYIKYCNNNSIIYEVYF